MSPKMCCCTSLFAEIVDLEAVTRLSCIQRHAEAPLTSVTASVDAGESHIEDVLPVRRIGVIDRQVAKKPLVAEVEAGVEAVLRRPVDVVDAVPAAKSSISGIH